MASHVLLAFVLTAVAATTAYAESINEDDPWQIQATRKMLQFRQPLGFPYSRCSDFKATGQPYYLVGPNVTTSGDSATFTFEIRYKGHREQPSPCYSMLEKSLDKIMIHVYSECLPALRVANNITVNGQRKGFNTYEYPTGTTLTVSNLKLTSSTASGTKIAITSVAPCTRPRYLFKPNNYRGVPMEFIFTDSLHKCCGRNW